MAAPSLLDAVSDKLGYAVDASELERVVRSLSTLYPEKVRSSLTLGLDSVELRSESESTESSEPRQAVTETPEFKTWFGNSNVVDPDGEPLVVYHGTDATFDEFDNAQADSRRSSGSGFFFTTDRKVAAGYGENVKPVYLKSESLLEIDFAGQSRVSFAGHDNLTPSELSAVVHDLKMDLENYYAIDEEIQDELREYGIDLLVDSTIDGIKMTNVNDSMEFLGGKPTTNFVVFSPSQIRPVEAKGRASEAWTPYHGKRGGEGWQWNGQGKPRYQTEKPRESGEGVAVDVPSTPAGVSATGHVADDDTSQERVEKIAEPRPVVNSMQALGELYPQVADMYAQDAGVSEGYSIGEHTGMVLDMWSRQASPAQLDGLSERLGVDVTRLMHSTLLLHDIGKPLAIQEGEKWRQHEFTLPIMADVLAKEGFSEQEVKLAQAVVGHDIFGEVLKGRLSPQAGADRKSVV
jgi:hypothetical protein